MDRPWTLTIWMLTCCILLLLFIVHELSGRNAVLSIELKETTQLLECVEVFEDVRACKELLDAPRQKMLR